MKVYITLDKIDGTQSRIAGPINVDEINLSGMLFRLLETDVAGVTFTRSDLLHRIEEKK